MRKSFEHMDSKYKKYLKFDIQERQKMLSDSISVNTKFIHKITNDYLFMLGLNKKHVYAKRLFKSPESGHDKVLSQVKAFMREWSSLGASERAEVFQPVLDGVMRHYPKT